MSAFRYFALYVQPVGGGGEPPASKAPIYYYHHRYHNLASLFLPFLAVIWGV